MCGWAGKQARGQEGQGPGGRVVAQHRRRGMGGLAAGCPGLGSLGAGTYHVPRLLPWLLAQEVLLAAKMQW